jgi:hypothetical protein
MIIHTCVQGRNCLNTPFEMVYLNGLTHLIPDTHEQWFNEVETV